eukprot:gene24067-30366_t
MAGRVACWCCCMGRAARVGTGPPTAPDHAGAVVLTRCGCCWPWPARWRDRVRPGALRQRWPGGLPAGAAVRCGGKGGTGTGKARAQGQARPQPRARAGKTPARIRRALCDVDLVRLLVATCAPVPCASDGQPFTCCDAFACPDALDTYALPRAIIRPTPDRGREVLSRLNMPTPRRRGFGFGRDGRSGNARRTLNKEPEAMTQNVIHLTRRPSTATPTTPQDLASTTAENVATLAAHQEAENALSMALHYLRSSAGNIPGATRKAVQALGALN